MRVLGKIMHDDDDVDDHGDASCPKVVRAEYSEIIGQLDTITYSTRSNRLVQLESL